MKKIMNCRATRRKQIFIVDDHPVFRTGLISLIQDEEEWTVCGVATTVRQAIGTIERIRPDLVLADMSLPGESGLELIKEIKSRSPSTLVLVISVHDESIYAERALRAGAQGYIMKTGETDEIRAAIRQVFNGQMYVSQSISNRILTGLSTKHEPESHINRLSDRELEVLMMLGQGKGTHNVARSLHLSSKTVDAHRCNIKAKLRLKTAAELLCYAARWMEAEHAVRKAGGARGDRKIS